MASDTKVWVEAERSKDGQSVVLTLKDVALRRRIAQENRGSHSARLPRVALEALGFPMQLVADLNKGRPIRFRMNELAFRNLVHHTSSNPPALGEMDEDGSEEFEVDLSEEAVISDAGRLGSKTSASFAGKHIGVFDEEAEAIAALRREAKRQKYWPGLFRVSDHGNIIPMSWLDWEEV